MPSTIRDSVLQEHRNGMTQTSINAVTELMTGSSHRTRLQIQQAKRLAGFVPKQRNCTTLDALRYQTALQNPGVGTYEGVTKIVDSFTESDTPELTQVIHIIRSLKPETRVRTIIYGRQITEASDPRAYRIINYLRENHEALSKTNPSITTLITWFKLAGLKYSRSNTLVSYTEADLDLVANVAIARSANSRIINTAHFTPKEGLF